MTLTVSASLVSGTAFTLSAHMGNANPNRITISITATVASKTDE